MKKLVTLLVAVVLTLAMSMTAFAADPTMVYNPSDLTSVTVPAESEVAYQGYVGGMVLTVNGADAYVVYNGETHSAVEGVVSVTFAPAMGRMPVDFSIGNSSATEATYAVSLTYPVGSQMNPAVADGMVSVSVEEGNNQGYYLTYTATEDGLVQFIVYSATEGVEYDVQLTNMSTYTMKTLAEDGVDNGYGYNTVSVYAEAGDEIAIVVSSLPDEDWNYPAVEVEGYVGMVGTEFNPIQITEDVFDVSLLDGTKLYYAGYLAGNTLVVKGENAYVIYNGKAYQATNGVVEVEIPAAEGPVMGRPMPDVIQIGNATVLGESEWASYKVYTVQNVYPEGSEKNPIIVSKPADMPAKVDVAVGESKFYSIGTALNGIEMTVTGEKGLFVVLVSGNVSETIFDEDNDGVVVVALNQTTREALLVGFDNKWGMADISNTVSLAWPAGHVNNPIAITNPSSLAEVKVPAEGDMSYTLGSNFDGAILTVEGTGVVIVNGTATEVDGSADVAVDTVDGVALVTFVNEADEDATYKVSVSYPAGHVNNPIAITNPSSLAEVKVPAEGDVTYSLNGNFDGAILSVVGDGLVIVNGTVTEVKGTADVEVETIDGVAIVTFVNEADEDATYKVAVSYPAGHVNNPISVINPSTLTEVKVSANGDMNYTLASNFDGAILTVTGTGIVVVNGEVIEVKESEEIEVSINNGVAALAFVNESAKDATFKVAVSYPEGHVNNPIELNNPSSLPATLEVAEGQDVTFKLGPNFDGAVLNVKGEDVTVVVNGEIIVVDGSEDIVLETVDGVVEVAIVNTGAEDAEYELSVGYPAGHVNNPIAVTNPSTLTEVKVPADGSVTYSLNKNFDGAYMVVTGNGTVYVNGEEVKVDKNVTVDLEVVGGSLIVTFENATDKEVTYAVEVGYPVGHVNNPLHLERPASMDEVVKVEANGEFYYSYGMAFEGAVLTVEGENAVVIVNGTVYEAKDGAVEIILPEGEQSIVVGFINETDKAVEYKVSLDVADVDTGDNTSIMPVIVMVLAAGAFVAVVDKKRKMA